jgi:hypothetical protein
MTLPRSKVAMRALEDIEAEMHVIPPTFSRSKPHREHIPYCEE